MISKRPLLITVLVAASASGFVLGAIAQRKLGQADRASYDTRLDALRDQLQRVLSKVDEGRAVGTAGRVGEVSEESPKGNAERDRLVAEIKQQLQNEMGLLSPQLLRERQSSFVELHTVDARGQKNYGTAGYLGDGYFVTVKHAVVSLAGEEPHPAPIVAITVVFKGKEIPARLIDQGRATMEVDPGDWAIIKTRSLDLPALKVDPAFSFEFADPIFRFGNDYSKGVVVSTGYIGQRTPAGLVTSLTDGHPGASGGGILDQRGVLVGIPIGRMQGDFRFSFILPIRAEMFRRVPGLLSTSPAVASINAH